MDPILKTIKTVRKTLDRYEMVERGDRIIVAVSGGPDSVCLLDSLRRLQDELHIELLIAHYDHGLRPGEDEGETRFVRNLAVSMGLSFTSEKGHLLNKTSGMSVEETAREARYAFLENLSKRLHAQKIAVGHNLNDQAETVLMRLLRGSGPSGLAGIPPVRDKKIIRPLIDLSRNDILSYLEHSALSSITDSSNLRTDFLRNKIRQDLMPRLLEYQPRLIEHLGGLAHLLTEENRFMDKKADAWLEHEARSTPAKAVLIRIAPFLDLPRPLRNRIVRRVFLRTLDNLRRISQGHIQSVTQLAESPHPQGELHLPGGLRVRKVYGTLSFSRGENHGPAFYRLSIDGPGTFQIKAIHRSISLDFVDADLDPCLHASPDTAFLDADKVLFPMVLRSVQPGDRFMPLGMKGSKKIKDFFIDLKVPSRERTQIPILFSGDIPVWVCGYRIDDRFKITPATKKVLKVILT